jgi:hypothetical protein
MKITRVVIFSTVILLALALAGTALIATAQIPIEQPVDETLGAPKVEGPAPIGAEVPFGGTPIILDDFNRADGSIGAKWTVHNGYCNVSNNAAVCGNNGRATYNNAPGNGNFAEADIAINGTSLQYTGLLLNFGAGMNNLFLKVQSQDPGKFTHAACYIGNNGDPFGLGFFSLTSYFSTAHMTALRVGSKVTIKFTNVDGGSQPDQTYVCDGAPDPEGTGIGILGYPGIARLDNFGIGMPDVAIDPSALHMTLPPDELQTQPITICNIGGMPLNWVQFEVPDIASANVTLDSAASSDHSQQVELTLDDTALPDPPQQIESTLDHAVSSDLPQQSDWTLNNTVPITLPNQARLIWKSDESTEQTTTVSSAPEGVTALLLDDGSGEELWGFYFGGKGLIFLNRFTPDPSDFPLQLNEVRIYSGQSVGEQFNLAIFENTTSGSDPAPGSNLVYTSTLTVQASNAWNVYALDPPLTFNGPGDILIGVLPLETADPGWYFWMGYVDLTISQKRSWFGWWGNNPLIEPPLLPPDAAWILWEEMMPTSAGNWMFRAYGETIGMDIPWLREYPIHGPTAAGICTHITVTFDSTGLAHGDYIGSLQVNSNDTDMPNITVPVTLTVIAPDIEVTPLSLEMTLLPDEIGTLPFTLNNVGTVDLTWNLTDGAPWLSEDLSSGSILPGGSKEVIVTFDATGLALGNYTATIIITSNDPTDPSISLPVTLTVKNYLFFLPLTQRR